VRHAAQAPALRERYHDPVSGILNLASSILINPNVAKAGGLQSQGVKGEAVLGYREPLTTQDLKASGFPEG